jgi:hypothetical protein
VHSRLEPVEPLPLVGFLGSLTPTFKYSFQASYVPSLESLSVDALVGHADNSVRHSGSRRAAAQTLWAVLQPLVKGLPFPADCALPTTFVPRLNITELSAWPTSRLTTAMCVPHGKSSH